MKWLRWALVALTGLYALMSCMPAFSTLAYKFGVRYPDGMLAETEPLMIATTTPILTMWMAALVLYVAAAVMLATRKGKAFAAYALAFGVDLSIWLMMSGTEAYAQVFPPDQRTMDLAYMAVLVLIGFGYWWVERKSAAPAAA